MRSMLEKAGLAEFRPYPQAPKRPETGFRCAEDRYAFYDREDAHLEELSAWKRTRRESPLIGLARIAGRKKKEAKRFLKRAGRDLSAFSEEVQGHIEDFNAGPGLYSQRVVVSGLRTTARTGGEVADGFFLKSPGALMIPLLAYGYFALSPQFDDGNPIDMLLEAVWTFATSGISQ